MIVNWGILKQVKKELFILDDSFSNCKLIVSSDLKNIEC